MPRDLAAAAAVGAMAAAIGLALLTWRRRLRPTRLALRLKDGRSIGGCATGGVARFLGVPFAAPPVGADRWRPPKPLPPAAADEVQSAQSWAPLWRAPQPDLGWNKRGTAFGVRVADSEAGCLQLNVWTPEALIGGGEALRPVLFYIHGGAGKLMSAHDDDYSGHQLAARHGLVYVAAQYRLGALGFMAHPALSAEDDEGGERGSGNYAVLDLVAALRWVQAHGASFGGDPANVTIWGLSTGAQLVATLLVSPLAEELFHRAMIQSCVDLTNVRELRGRHEVWQHKTAEEWGRALAAALGCASDDAAEELRRCRSLPASAIVDKSWDTAATDCYEPAVDRRAGLGAAKPLTSVEALSSGRFHRVPVLLGVTADDGLGKAELEWTMFDDVATVDEYRRLLERKLGAERLAEALRLYPAESDNDVEVALGRLSDDLWYAVGSWAMADLLVDAPAAAPVYVYRVTQTGHTEHGSDTPLWNGSRWGDDGRPAGPAPDAAMAFLANFALSGDPNGAGLPRWEAHTQEAPLYMQLGEAVGMRGRDEAEAARYALLGAWIREELRDGGPERERLSESAAARRN